MPGNILVYVGSYSRDTYSQTHIQIHKTAAVSWVKGECDGLGKTERQRERERGGGGIQIEADIRLTEREEEG